MFGKRQGICFKRPCDSLLAASVCGSTAVWSTPAAGSTDTPSFCPSCLLWFAPGLHGQMLLWGESVPIFCRRHDTKYSNAGFQLLTLVTVEQFTQFAYQLFSSRCMTFLKHTLCLSKDVFIANYKLKWITTIYWYVFLQYVSSRFCHC